MATPGTVLDNRPHEICCIGAGCVGVCFMASLAFHCPAVVRITILDEDPILINQWTQYPNAPQPVYEPDLQLRLPNSRVEFLDINTVQGEARLRTANIIFVCTEDSDYFDLAHWENAYRRISSAIRAQPLVNPRIVVDKTTALMDALDRITTIRVEEQAPEFALVFNPKLFSEGRAIHDIDHPSRVFLGCPPPPAAPNANIHTNGLTLIRALYNSWVRINLLVPIKELNFRSFHMAKIATNVLLASQITTVNTISSLCTSEGVDCREVMSTVPGFQQRYMNFGIGFGGPGLIKDVKYAIYLATKYEKNVEANVLRNILRMNMRAKQRFVSLIMDTLGTVQDKQIAIFGFAHKANTNDCRESPAIDICKMLLQNGAVLRIHDPFVHQDKIVEAIGPVLRRRQRFSVHNAAFQPLETTVLGTEAICILTDHPQYVAVNFPNLEAQMRIGRHHHIFDGRNTNINWAGIGVNGFQLHLGGG